MVVSWPELDPVVEAYNKLTPDQRLQQLQGAVQRSTLRPRPTDD